MRIQIHREVKSKFWTIQDSKNGSNKHMKTNITSMKEYPISGLRSQNRQGFNFNINDHIETHR